MRGEPVPIRGPPGRRLRGVAERPDNDRTPTRAVNQHRRRRTASGLNRRRLHDCSQRLRRQIQKRSNVPNSPSRPIDRIRRHHPCRQTHVVHRWHHKHGWNSSRVTNPPTYIHSTASPCGDRALLATGIDVPVLWPSHERSPRTTRSSAARKSASDMPASRYSGPPCAAQAHPPSRYRLSGRTALDRPRTTWRRDKVCIGLSRIHTCKPLSVPKPRLAGSTIGFASDAGSIKQRSAVTGQLSRPCLFVDGVPGLVVAPDGYSALVRRSFWPLTRQ